ncbi:MAG: hypothetical protein WDN24_06915 [Sphingomonas sp.]
MMEGLEARGRAAGARGVARAVERIAARVREEYPGVAAEPVPGGVALSGRGLRMRLRWIAGLIR